MKRASGIFFAFQKSSFVIATLMAMALPAFAQSNQPTGQQMNQRLQEEAVLDQTREQRVQDIIRAREADEERIKREGLTPEEIEKRHLVEVEPNNILPPDLSSTYGLVPYKVRRNDWGLNFTLGYSTYTPKNYQSRYATAQLESFEALYGSTGAGLMEVAMNYKYNFFLGSLGVEGAYGFYSNDTDDISFGEGNIDLQQLRLGMRYTMDNFGYEPIVAPYVGGGVYTMLFKEDFGGGNSFNGNTSPAPYVNAGVLFQLNWIDKSTAVESYTEAGIENTFVFVEARKYMASAEPEDPDFSTDIEFAGGLTLEF